MSEVAIERTWQAESDRWRKAAIEFWGRLELLPEEVALRRARNLTAIAHDDGKLVGVATAGIGYYEPLRVNLAAFRAAVDPEYRRADISRELTRETMVLLEEWAVANPEAELAGIYVIFESEFLRMRKRHPISDLDFVLIGYTEEGYWKCVKWFNHILL